MSGRAAVSSNLRSGACILSLFALAFFFVVRLAWTGSADLSSGLGTAPTRSARTDANLGGGSSAGDNGVAKCCACSDARTASGASTNAEAATLARRSRGDVAAPPQSVASGGGGVAATANSAAISPEDDVPSPLPPIPTWQRGPGGFPPGGNTAPGPSGFFERLRGWGYQPALILDVGANEGAWAREAWSAFGAPPSGGAPPQLLMFEGAPGRTNALLGAGFDFVISVMGPRVRYVDFFASDVTHTGNSVLRENSRHFAAVAPTRTLMRTVDELVAARPGAMPGAAAAAGNELVTPLLPGPTILKLDVQGYEVEVLKGATRTLASVDVLLLETSVLPYNRGSPLTADIMAFLGAQGFAVLDMLELHHAGPQNVLIQIDFAFARTGSALVRKAAEGAGLSLD